MTANRHRAFSLIEVITVIAIILLIAGLLLLAVQSARESVRKLTCTNNLKQIGLAFQNYEATYKMLPAGATPKLAISPFVAILPQLEQSAIFDQFDFSKFDIYDLGPVIQTRIATYRCPSTQLQEIARTDYALNRGTTLTPDRDSPWLFEERQWPVSSHFRNGTSNTALLAEICPFVPGITQGAYRRISTGFISTKEKESIAMADCESALESPTSHFDNGRVWVGSGTYNYYHLRLPNQWSCENRGGVQESLDTAVSMHSSGVNVLFADGHIDFVTEEIYSSAWMALGSR